MEFLFTFSMSYRVLAGLLGQLLALACFFLLFTALFKNKKTAFILSAFGAIFWVLELSAVYLNGQLVDYRYYLHFNFANAKELLHFFPLHFLAYLLLAYLLFSLFFNGSRKLRAFSLFRPWRLGVLCAVPFFWICKKKAIVPCLADIYRITQTEVFSFDESLERLGIPPMTYVLPKDVEAQSGKNIIVLVLESFEAGLLDKSFQHLTPALQHCAADWTYLPVQPHEGSSWTAGSIYTAMTGMPAYFLLGANQIFQNTASVQITGLPHVLKKAGYELNYFIARPEFAGMEYLFSAYGMPVQSERTFAGPYPKFKFGMHDKDLFDEFKKALLQIKNANRPFAYFFSSVSTHFPDGIYDPRMEVLVGQQKSNLECMIKATDFHVQDLLTFLEKENMLDNTAVFIFPDHLMMGSTARILQDLEEPRGLYVITNAAKNSLELSTEKVYQIDLPKLILQGAGVRHNALFLTDAIQGDKGGFMEKNQGALLSLNESSIQRSIAPIVQTQDSVPPEKDVKRFIAHAGGKIAGQTYTNALEALDFSYKKGFRLFELDILKTADGHYVAAHDWRTWAQKTGYMGTDAPTLAQFLQHPIDTLTPLDMLRINQWFAAHADAVLVTDKIQEPLAFSKAFLDPSRLMMELKTMDAVREGMKANIRSVMPSQSIFTASLFGNKVKMLKDLGITDVAVSRTLIEKKPLLLAELKANGIRVYVYHVNAADGKNEKYVVEHELGQVYGLYADEWDF